MKNNKLKLGTLSAALLAAVVVAPTMGSAAGLSNAPFHLKATNLEQSGTYAIKPGIKKAGESSGIPAPEPTSEPGSGSTPFPSGGATSTPAPTSSPSPSYPTPSRAAMFSWDVAADGGASLIGLSNNTTTETAVVIPERAVVKGVERPVTYISTARARGLTSVVIPDSVAEIRAFAFADNKLTSIGLPSNVTTIGSHAFANNQLTSVVIPDRVTDLQSSAFSKNKITSVIFGKAMTSIQSFVFEYNSLESIEIPETITSVEGYAFQNNSLKSVKLPSRITYIGPSAFKSNQLTGIDLPEGLQTVDEQAFGANAYLTEVTIPSTVTSIGSYAFSHPNLKKVYMKGDAPTTFVSTSKGYGSFGSASGKIVYYKAGATGYSNPWNGYTTATY